jgi:hypothetical protein
MDSKSEPGLGNSRGLKMPALFFNFKAKGSKFKHTQIPWRKDASTEVVVRTIFS